MSELTQVERRIVKALDSILDSKVAASASDYEWTVAVKRQLGKVGLERGYSVCATDGGGKYESEWLFDLIWYTNDSQDNLENIQLIAEVEWAMSYDEIQYDFEKLKAGRADLRVLIFQAPDRQKIDEYMRRFIKNIAAFKYSMRGDRYLFAAYDQRSEVFEYRVFEY